MSNDIENPDPAVVPSVTSLHQEMPITTPRPDPTDRTLRFVLEEVSRLKELLKSENIKVREVIETRLSGMDKGIQLIQAAADKVPSQLDIAIAQLKNLQDVKFDSVALQFRERDVRTEQTSKDSKVAVDAALAAQKEAAVAQNKNITDSIAAQNQSLGVSIAKSEAAFTKQIDLITANLDTNSKNLDSRITDSQKTLEGKVTDLKERLTTIETYGKSGDKIIGYVVGIAGVAFAGMAFFLRLHGGP